MNILKMNGSPSWTVDVTSLENGNYNVAIILNHFYPICMSEGEVPASMKNLIDEMQSNLHPDSNGIDHGYSPARLALYLMLVEHMDQNDPLQESLIVETVTTLPPRCAYVICFALFSRFTRDEISEYLFNHPDMPL